MRVYVGSGGSTRVDKTSVTVSIDSMRGNERCNLSCVMVLNGQDT
jgi:hypothetical protein